MNIKAPKKNTFWIAVGIAALGVVLYAAHVILTYLVGFGEIGYIRPAAFALETAAFILICLGITIKGL